MSQSTSSTELAHFTLVGVRDASSTSSSPQHAKDDQTSPKVLTAVSEEDARQDAQPDPISVPRTLRTHTTHTSPAASPFPNIAGPHTPHAPSALLSDSVNLHPQSTPPSRAGRPAKPKIRPTSLPLLSSAPSLASISLAHVTCKPIAPPRPASLAAGPAGYVYTPLSARKPGLETLRDDYGVRFRGRRGFRRVVEELRGLRDRGKTVKIQEVLGRVKWWVRRRFGSG